MLTEHHQQTLWVYWTLVLLGVWTALAPFKFGYLNERGVWVDPSGGRGAWWSRGDAYRAAGQADDVERRGRGRRADDLRLARADAEPAGQPVDLLLRRRLVERRRCSSGRRPRRRTSTTRWWARSSSRSTSSFRACRTCPVHADGPPMPPGWSYNPSSWPQRWIMIALGFAGWIVSRYLAAVPARLHRDVWDPFSSATAPARCSIHACRTRGRSPMRRLGEFSYTFEFLMGFMGGPSRWRTMPWMVTFFGILVIPLGLTHIVLVISQPVIVGAWCTFCFSPRRSCFR